MHVLRGSLGRGRRFGYLPGPLQSSIHGHPPRPVNPPEAIVFDLDGTLLDSDRPLTDAFVALGVPPSELTFGHVLAEECSRLGIDLAAYLAAYDSDSAVPFPGVEVVVSRLERWAICSNKHPDLAWPELERLGWKPEVALFADAFSGGAKQLSPVLALMDIDVDSVLYVGDTDHDRRLAKDLGCGFALAGWNPRTRPLRGEWAPLDPGEILAPPPVAP